MGLGSLKTVLIVFRLPFRRNNKKAFLVDGNAFFAWMIWQAGRIAVSGCLCLKQALAEQILAAGLFATFVGEQPLFALQAACVAR